MVPQNRIETAFFSELVGRSSELFLGIDIGGTETRVGLLNGATLSYLDFSTKVAESFVDPDNLISRISGAARFLLGTYGASLHDLKAVGCCVCGPVSGDVNGRLVMASSLGWKKRVPLSTHLRHAFPLSRVFVTNDMFAAMLAEKCYGRGKVVKDMLLLTLSSGYGGSLLLNGSIQESVFEPGHTVLCSNGRLCKCGQRGCVEAYIAGPSLAARFIEEITDWQAIRFLLAELNTSSFDLNNPVQLQAIPPLIVQSAAMSLEAKHFLEDSGAMWGVSIANLLKVMSFIKAVVLMGGVTLGANEFLFPSMERAMVQSLHYQGLESPSVTLTAFGKHIGILGSCLLGEYYN